MKTLTFTATDEGDGRIVSEMGETDFSMMEIIGILTNQVVLLSEKARGQVPVVRHGRGSSQGSTH